MHWLTCTHAIRWRLATNSVGEGAVYQSRYKAIPIQTDHHFLTVARYVERNPLRAGLAARAEHWRWSSYWHRQVAHDGFPLARWPVAAPSNWSELVHQRQPRNEIAAIRRCVNAGCGIGNARWQAEVAKTLGIPSPASGPGRPRSNPR
jgi:putative transposase